ncbi:hypothetical protein BCU70_00625 [Vibrio sp. 10N.286.49.C2]|uniref:hypothetical protein n=1 Tax=unclassified Vibrio TaxID=2614977 RepID=UPI000C82DC7B|nr:MULTISPECIES: hypothetical protein [unclassified Vibrio]PMH43399.1 hypothetical protein BCU70_00625 [Vibrio sp. 10N.286.49.C2]PMH57051.1 hypothetical protein BCU66_06015 [Vibrio sp. 10N.286.49.B1]PMH78531.1 hypothetical protein BCU58_08860 [Vibrio sp. 10N.286.48.B7]
MKRYSLRHNPKLMMLLIMSMLALSPASMAINSPEASVASGQTEQYARVVARGKLLSLTKWKVEVDFGQEVEISIRNKGLLRDESGNTVSFNSPIDAVNFLNSKGWVLVSASSSSGHFSAILKRSVQ